MLIEEAEESWRRNRDTGMIELLLKGNPFQDGVAVGQSTASAEPRRLISMRWFGMLCTRIDDGFKPGRATNT